MIELFRVQDLLIPDIECFRNEFLKHHRRIPGSFNLEKYDNVYLWLVKIREQESAKELKNGCVHSTQFLAYKDKTLVGMIDLRHSLNDYLLNYGGNIGYAVAKEHENKGYATEMVKEVLIYAKSIGLSKVLISCKTTNLSSEKVILKCGGILDDIRFDQDENFYYKRFWIKI